MAHFNAQTKSNGYMYTVVTRPTHAYGTVTSNVCHKHYTQVWGEEESLNETEKIAII